MARAKTNESRKAKPSAAEDLTHGITKLLELSTQIDDLSRDGFPYREAGRARTELSLRETIRRLFGDKSPEYQAHKNHKLRVGNRTESAQSTTLIKQLIAALERRNADLPNPKPPSTAISTGVAGERPALTSVPLVPPSAPPAALSGPGATPIAAVAMSSGPITVSAQMTGNLTAPVQAIAPVMMTTSASVDFLSFPASAPPLGPTRETPMLDQRDSPSVHPAGAMETRSSSVAPEEASFCLAIPAPVPPSPAPTIPAGTASPTEPAPSGGLQGPDDTLKSALSAIGSSPASPLEPVDSAIVGPPPDDNHHVAPTVAREGLSVQALSPLALKSRQPVRLAMEFATPPPAVVSGQKQNVENGGADSGTLDILRRVCARFHLVARQLRLRKEYRPTVEIIDECDLQDLFYALLRLQFDEVGTEERAPDNADGVRRTSYLLDWARTVVVVKLTKSGVTTKDLAEQVKSDAAYYAERPTGNTLLYFIYDPDGRVGNPRGLEADLTTVSDTYVVEVIVAPK